jgi:hypothetical protein
MDADLAPSYSLSSLTAPPPPKGLPFPGDMVDGTCSVVWLDLGVSLHPSGLAVLTRRCFTPRSPHLPLPPLPRLASSPCQGQLA